MGVCFNCLKTAFICKLEQGTGTGTRVFFASKDAWRNIFFFLCRSLLIWKERHSHMDIHICYLQLAILYCSLYSQLYLKQKQYHMMVMTNRIQQILSNSGKQATSCSCSHLLSIKQIHRNLNNEKSISNQWLKWAIILSLMFY